MLNKILPTRQARLSVAAAALATVSILGSARPAAASEFTINACQADRANYSTDAFEDFATRGMLAALGQLPPDETTVLINKAHPHPIDDLRAVEECFRDRHPHRTVTIPYDRRLATMLDTGTYSLEALDARTRLPLKRLGLSVVEQLV
jgi:hypothetical protein